MAKNNNKIKHLENGAEIGGSAEGSKSASDSQPVMSTSIAAPVDLVVAEHTAAIHRLRQRVREDIDEIGRHLVAVRDRLERGAWLAWLEAEFGWSDQTAYRFIHIHEARTEFRIPHRVEFEPAAESALSAGRTRDFPR